MFYYLLVLLLSGPTSYIHLTSNKISLLSTLYVQKLFIILCKKAFDLYHKCILLFMTIELIAVSISLNFYYVRFSLTLALLLAKRRDAIIQNYREIRPAEQEHLLKVQRTLSKSISYTVYTSRQNMENLFFMKLQLESNVH